MKKAGFQALSVWMLLFFIPAFACAEETVDPYYAQWASFKTGSSVTLVGRAEDKAGSSAFTQTITLKEVGKDSLMIEIARKEEGAKPIVKTKKIDKFLATTDKMEFRGDEDISVDGKQIKCRRYTLIHMDNSGNEMIRFDYWFHPDIPGATKIAGTAKDANVSQTAVGWEKK